MISYLKDKDRTKFPKMLKGKNQAAKSLPFMSVSFELFYNLGYKGKLAVLIISTKNWSAVSS